MDNAGQRESGEFPASNLVSTESRPWEQDFLVHWVRVGISNHARVPHIITRFHTGQVVKT